MRWCLLLQHGWFLFHPPMFPLCWAKCIPPLGYGWDNGFLHLSWLASGIAIAPNRLLGWWVWSQQFSLPTRSAVNLHLSPSFSLCQLHDGFSVGSQNYQRTAVALACHLARDVAGLGLIHLRESPEIWQQEGTNICFSGPGQNSADSRYPVFRIRSGSSLSKRQRKMKTNS